MEEVPLIESVDIEGIKMDMRSSQDSNLGLVSSVQMLLPTEPLALHGIRAGNIHGVYP